MDLLDQTYERFKKINNTYYLIGVCVFAVIIRAIGVDPINLSIEEAEFFYFSHPLKIKMLCAKRARAYN